MKKHIIISLIMIFALFSLGTGIAIYNLVTNTKELRYLITLHEIEDIRQDLHFYVSSVEELVNASPENLTTRLDDIVMKVRKVNESVRRCQSCHHKPEIQGELLVTQGLVDTFSEKFSYLITTTDTGSWREENKKLAAMLSQKILQRVQDMINRATFTIQKKTRQATRAIDRSYVLLLMSLFLTFVIAFFVAQHLTNKVTSPVEVLLNATRKIRDGDLGFQADYQATAEFKELMHAFNEMSSGLAAKDIENKRLYYDLMQKVDELTRTQRQLVEAEKLTALGTLAGGIAHDFNNILCGILSNISLLKRKQIPAESETTVLDTIEKAGFRASKLIQQLLTFAQQTKWEIADININEHLINIVALFKNTLPENITVTLDLAENLPLFQGDSTRIEQVFMNLLVNSRDAIDEAEGGGITLRTTLADPSNTPEIKHNLQTHTEHYIAVDVEDTGTGISEEIMPRIFEPFFTTKPFGKGTGLGLAMVHGIIKGHKGFCIVSNNNPHGTKFSVYLPV